MVPPFDKTGRVERTEWRLRDQPMGWLAYLGPLPLALVLVSSLRDEGWYTPQFWAALVGLLLLVAAGVWAAGRLRVRLTADGVEVRQFRTRLYPWTEIAAVQLAPEQHAIAVVLRTQSMHQRPQPEILPLPRGKGRRPSDTTIQDAMSAIDRRITPPKSPDHAA